MYSEDNAVRNNTGQGCGSGSAFIFPPESGSTFFKLLLDPDPY